MTHDLRAAQEALVTDYAESYIPRGRHAPDCIALEAGL